MRKNIVAGNWKMNKTLQEGIALAKELNEVLANERPNCDVIICTPFIHLASVTPLVDSAKIGVGAENCADKESGAYTGEVSAAMVASTGAKYVILGHSERRAYYHETPEILKEKVRLALASSQDRSLTSRPKSSPDSSSLTNQSGLSAPARRQLPHKLKRYTHTSVA